jgi:hypothetical protein
MLLATIFLLCPFPQSGDFAKNVTEHAAIVAVESEKEASEPKALPSAPEPKVKSDAERASDSSPAAVATAGATPIAAGNPALTVKPGNAVMAPSYETEKNMKTWYALMAVSSGAAAFDAWSTRRAISGGYGTEANPLLRPFSHSNAIYAATQVSPLVMDFIGRKMMTSRHNWMRKLWWLPQMAGTDVSVSSGIHNVSIVH